MKIQKVVGGGGRLGGEGVRVGGQVGCERRIEVFCENKKKSFFLVGGESG